MKVKIIDELVQTAVRLPRNLRDRLSKTGGERGLGEEIRRRLEASFETEAADPKTRELRDAISALADNLARDYGSWSEDAFAFEALKASVNLLLTHYKPKGEPVAHPAALAEYIYGPNASPKDVARFLVSSWINEKAKRASADSEKRR